jgi:hypothetical protein
MAVRAQHLSRAYVTATFVTFRGQNMLVNANIGFENRPVTGVNPVTSIDTASPVVGRAFTVSSPKFTIARRNRSLRLGGSGFHSRFKFGLASVHLKRRNPPRLTTSGHLSPSPHV